MKLMFGLGRAGRAVVTSEVIILRVLIWVLVVWVPTWGQCIQPGALRICALTFKVNSGKERGTLPKFVQWRIRGFFWKGVWVVPYFLPRTLWR